MGIEVVIHVDMGPGMFFNFIFNCGHGDEYYSILLKPYQLSSLCLGSVSSMESWKTLWMTIAFNVNRHGYKSTSQAVVHLCLKQNVYIQLNKAIGFEVFLHILTLVKEHTYYLPALAKLQCRNIFSYHCFTILNMLIEL